MTFFDRMAKILGRKNILINFKIIKSFYLGNHFTSIADKEDKQKKTNIDPEVNKLLQDEQVRQLLLDPDVVKFMKFLREEPDKAQR